EIVVAVRDPRPRLRITRVSLDCLLKVFNSFQESLGRSLVPVVPPLQAKLIRLGVLRFAFGKAVLFLGREPYAEPFRDFTRDFFLERQDVGELPAVVLAPDLRAITPIHELRLHDESVASMKDAPAQHGSNTELAADALRIRGAALVTGDRAARH